MTVCVDRVQLSICCGVYRRSSAWRKGGTQEGGRGAKRLLLVDCSQEKPSGPCLEASSRQWTGLTPRVWYSGVIGRGGFDSDWD
jgi:hypothetical protein